MTNVREKGTKIFTNEDYSENVPLWRALAEFTSEDLDEGLQANAAVIAGVKPPFARAYNLASIISAIFTILFIILFVLSLVGLVIGGQANWQNLFTTLLATALLIAAAPQLWRHIDQFGWKIPAAPLELPHASDPRFEEFIRMLQKETGPRAYTVSRFRKRRVLFKRQQFFGKLRYFLFSEYSADRAMVMRFGTGFSLPSDIFLRRDHVDTMLNPHEAVLTPAETMLTPPETVLAPQETVLAPPVSKRPGGPGRNPKYRYTDSAIALIGDPRIGTLDLNNRAESVRSVKNWLDSWFMDHVDESGGVPRQEQVMPIAEKIVDQLAKTAPPKGD